MDSRECLDSENDSKAGSPSASSLLAAVQSHDSTIMELPLFEARPASRLRKVPDAIAWPGTPSVCSAGHLC